MPFNDLIIFGGSKYSHYAPNYYTADEHLCHHKLSREQCVWARNTKELMII